ncbi:hypothetical protein GCM10008018_62160 [Paenibacillus marchantiophytorum]|uniref:PF03932 family protein CutC n=1 Tax=Paenibacillus marchantiophytorum TaxID=1619310 RepID=A0ABQ1FDR3_9BACL|nr:copper homeostasis protein CutC [Paenibacillus marchantiophytorum]GGA08001.1 hypothetical protein GCM10008018_62160 [Paenibacillus marchantiophytorum]
MVLLEVIATTLEDARNAEAGGADRIELVANLEEGGLTPSLKLVQEIASELTIPVHVMIRPHSRSFHMSEEDVAQMINDSKRAYQAGASALVLGALTSEKTIDRNVLELLLEATPLPVTYHRAFDEIVNQEDAVSTLLDYAQIRSVLTSGGAARALDAVEQMKRLVRRTEGHTLQIMAGGGVTLASLKSFVNQTKVPCIHMGTGVREQLSIDKPVSVEKVMEARRLLANLDV